MRKKQSGQSTIEFILASVLGMTVFFFFIKLSMVFAYSTYVQYATFMSSRAYLSAGYDKSDQYQRAENVLRSMLKVEGNPNADRFAFIARPKNLGGNLAGATIGNGPAAQAGGGESSVNSSWQLGVRYDIEFKMFFGGLSKSKNIELNSESWLGRETSYEECKSWMSSKGPWIFDNGC